MPAWWLWSGCYGVKSQDHACFCVCLSLGLSVLELRISSSAGELQVISLCSVCEAIADGSLELAESAALMSDDCIKAVIKLSILCLATPYKRLLTVLGLREKPLNASARLREAANPPAECQCWTNGRHPHVAVLTTLFHFDCSTSGIISTFLHVHPFGASIEYICSYLQRLDTKVTGLRDSKCCVSVAGWTVSHCRCPQQKERWILYRCSLKNKVQRSAVHHICFYIHKHIESFAAI